MNMTRRGFLWGLVKASAAVAVVANVIKKAPSFKITKVISDLSHSRMNRDLMSGKLKWVNLQDVKCGNRIGNFQGTFEIFPKPRADSSRLAPDDRAMLDAHIGELLKAQGERG